MPPDAPSIPHATAAIRSPWRDALLRFALAWLAVAVIAAREWGEMLHQYWDIDTYNHVLLVPAIVGWLVWIRRDDVAKIGPYGWWPGLVAVAVAAALWAVGRASGTNLLAHAGAVGMLQASVLALLGPRVAALLAFPIAYAAFLIPFGDEIVPPLQMVTAEITIALTHASGVPAQIDGIHIDTPAGLFIVAEACSGVKFLIAMIALGVLVCFTMFESWTKRLVYIFVCVVVPILANGVRAWGTIYLAQFVGAETAGGFDHIVYGWVFFALVVALMLGIALRFAEREPEDAGWTLAQVDALLPSAERWSADGGRVLLALAAIVALAALV